MQRMYAAEAWFKVLASMLLAQMLKMLRNYIDVIVHISYLHSNIELSNVGIVFCVLKVHVSKYG